MNAKEKAEEIAEIACFRAFCTCEINVVKLIELALIEAHVAGMRDAAEIVFEQAKSYHDQLEGHGEPEFSKLEFASGGMLYTLGLVRQRAEELEKDLK